MSDDTITSMFPSRWMRAEDLTEDTTGTIVAIDRQEVGPGELKPCLHFREPFLRPLIINKTNGLAIAAVLGTPNVRQWIGKQVTLYATHTHYQGKQVPCVRIREGRPAAAAETRPPRRPDHQRPPAQAGAHAPPRPPMAAHQRPPEPYDAPPMDDMDDRDWANGHDGYR
jgi:hypothetical protein